jgi:hypothetical protein
VQFNVRIAGASRHREHVRRERAQQLLSRGLSVREVAKSLGFSEFINSHAPIARLAIAADATNVYWANCGSFEESYNGSIASAPSSGGTVTTLAAERNDPISIAVDDSYVYWTDWGENAWSNGAVLRVPKTGGAVVTLASARNDAASIVVAAGTVFFTDTIGLESVPAAGGMVTTVLAGAAVAYAVDGANFYWAASPGAIVTHLCPFVPS